MATMADSEQVGPNIVRAREARGMTQGQLARLSGIKRQHLSDWERGVHEPRPRSLRRIAQVLDLPFGYFYGDYQDES